MVVGYNWRANLGAVLLILHIDCEDGLLVVVHLVLLPLDLNLGMSGSLTDAVSPGLAAR